MASPKPIPAKHVSGKFRPRTWGYWQALLEALLLIALLGLLYWMYHYSRDSSQWYIVVFLIVLVAPAVIYWCGRIMVLAWRCGRRYTIDANGITARNLFFFPKRVRREDIVGFDLLPGAFPKAPRAIVLHDRQGNRLTLDLSFKPNPAFHDALFTNVPGLNNHGLDRVCVCESSPVPSVWRVRFRKHHKDLWVIYITGIFTLMGLLACTMMVLDQINRIRIMSNPAVIEGTIEKIEVERGEHGPNVTLIVEYAPGDGHIYTTRRRADADIQGTRPGTPIRVQYLIGHPQTARLLDHDHDDNEYGEIVIFLLFTYISMIALSRASLAWLRPLRQPFAWDLVMNHKHRAVKTDDESLETLIHAMPQSTRSGAAVLTSLYADKIGVLTGQQAKALTRSGIENECVGDEYILLPGRSTQVLVDRLGWVGRTKADIVVLESQEIEGAAAWAKTLETKAGSTRKLAGISTTRWYHQDHLFGPVENKNAEAMFDRWACAHFLELFDHPNPPTLRGIGFAKMFGLPVIGHQYRLLAERTRSGLRLWIRDRKDGKIQCAESMSGRWLIYPRSKGPKAIREDSLLKRLLIGGLGLVFLPIVIFVILLFLPLYYLEHKMKAEKVRKQLEQMEPGK